MYVRLRRMGLFQDLEGERVDEIACMCIPIPLGFRPPRMTIHVLACEVLCTRTGLRRLLEIRCWHDGLSNFIHLLQKSFGLARLLWAVCDLELIERGL